MHSGTGVAVGTGAEVAVGIGVEVDSAAVGYALVCGVAFVSLTCFSPHIDVSLPHRDTGIAQAPTPPATAKAAVGVETETATGVTGTGTGTDETHEMVTETEIRRGGARRIESVGRRKRIGCVLARRWTRTR